MWTATFPPEKWRSKPRAVSEGVSAGVSERKRRATAPPDPATESDRDRDRGPAALEARDGSPPRETASILRVGDADTPPATAFTDAYAYVSPEKEPPPTIRRPSVPPRRRARRVRFRQSTPFTRALPKKRALAPHRTSHARISLPTSPRIIIPVPWALRARPRIGS